MNTKNNFKTIEKRLRELAFLNTGISIFLTDKRQAKEKNINFKYDGGIKEYVKYLNEGKNLINPNPIFFHGEKNNISEKLELAGLMPLWQREFDVARDPTKIFIAFGLFAICLLLVIFNYVPIVVAFLICVIGFVSSKLLTGEGVYRHIDWPVVILLAAMIPIGNTLISYGITDSVSSYLASLSSAVDYVWLVVLIMIITMFLSDIINNAATAVIMAPLAVSLADKINQPIEPFLMSVAIGASCAFLSPIGHQCNTLVMAPGNYKFGDYWKVGLPLEILIILISVPAIIFYWG